MAYGNLEFTNREMELNGSRVTAIILENMKELTTEAMRTIDMPEQDVLNSNTFYMFIGHDIRNVEGMAIYTETISDRNKVIRLDDIYAYSSIRTGGMMLGVYEGCEPMGMVGELSPQNANRFKGGREPTNRFSEHAGINVKNKILLETFIPEGMTHVKTDIIFDAPNRYAVNIFNATGESGTVSLLLKFREKYL